jgi:hypothetical protein
MKGEAKMKDLHGQYGPERTVGGNRARSGGGITSNKHVKVGVRAGSRTTNEVGEGAVARIGGQHVLMKPHPPLQQPRQAPVPLGNDLATNVGKGGPGVGREVFDCGSQGKH